MTERTLRRVEPRNEMRWEDECGCAWRFDLTRRLGEELVWSPCQTHEKMPKAQRKSAKKASRKAEKAPVAHEAATVSHAGRNGAENGSNGYKPPKATQAVLAHPQPRTVINLENPEICESCQ